MADDRGFTLVEVLVAATLFALVMMLAGEGLRSALGGWRAIERRASVDADMAAAQAVVRRLLTEAWPTVVRDRDGRMRLAFHGDGRRVRLVAAVPPGSGLVSAVELRLARGALVAVVVPVDPASRAPFAALEHGTATVLVDGLADGSFAFGGTGGEWTDTWGDHRSLPAAIRVRLEFPPEDARRWPELVAGARAESPVVF